MADWLGSYPQFRFNFEQQGKRAKELLKAARAGETEVPLQKLDQVVVRLNTCCDCKTIERETDGTLRAHITLCPAGFRPSRAARDRPLPD